MYENEEVDVSKFESGKSGNPGGRPKGLERLVRELVSEQREVDANGVDLDGWSRLTLRLFRIAMGDEHGNVREQIAAAKLLQERGYGYPKQTMDMTVGGSTLDTSDIAKLTDEELIELATATDHTGGGE
jgi:hypothetical protein